MTKILVPIDGSDTAKAAVKVALDWAKDRDITLDVVTVHPQLSGNVSRHVSAETINAYYREEGQLALNTVIPMLEQSGVKFEAHTLTGPVAQTLVDFAEKNGINHIIMGTRGMGSVKSLVIGSVATKVLSLTHLPVTMIK